MIGFREISDIRPSLLLREWLTIAVLFAFFLAIIIFSYMANREQNPLIHSALEDLVRIYIEGEVETPGLYVLKPGTTLGEVLNQAGLKNSSNIDKIDLGKIVREGEHIKIRPLKMVKIHLHYPEKLEKELELPKGTKISEVQRQMEGTSYEVYWPEKRRRVLREGDSITLRYKK